VVAAAAALDLEGVDPCLAVGAAQVGDQVGAEAAAGQDLGGQVGDVVGAVGEEPGFAAVAGDLGLGDESLDDEVLVALEGGAFGAVGKGTTCSRVIGSWAALARLAGPGRLPGGPGLGLGLDSSGLGVMVGRGGKCLSRAVS
jgi:hypothetical protein